METAAAACGTCVATIGGSPRTRRTYRPKSWRSAQKPSGSNSRGVEQYKASQLPPTYMSNDPDYLAKLRDYYTRHRALPSYALVGKLVGLRSKSSVAALVRRL